MKKDLIFVNIASYKDPELKYTVDRLYHKADNPDLIRVVICQQDSPENFKSFPYKNLKVINFDKIDSRGICWARRQVQNYYDDEEYFLQIDSHIALENQWDVRVRNQVKRVRKMTSNKIVMASYPAGYRIENEKRRFDNPMYSQTVLRDDNAYKFHYGMGGKVINFPNPLPTPYLNAGLMFGDGSFNIDCLYDPDIYIVGEELLNTLKAFTHGYDLYNPSVHIAWHLYKKWEEAEKWKHLLYAFDEDDSRRPVRFWERERESDSKVLKILKGELPDQLGKARTIQDYEKYIGRPVIKEDTK